MAKDDPRLHRHVDDALRALRDHVAGIDLDAAVNCGPFHLERKIGSGAVADVFAARLGRAREARHAVKLLRPGTGGEEMLERFLREQRILRSIKHPGIVEVVEAGIHPGGTPWFAMPLFGGAPITVESDSRRLGCRRGFRRFA